MPLHLALYCKRFAFYLIKKSIVSLHNHVPCVVLKPQKSICNYKILQYFITVVVRSGEHQHNVSLTKQNSKKNSRFTSPGEGTLVHRVLLDSGTPSHQEPLPTFGTHIQQTQKGTICAFAGQKQDHQVSSQLWVECIKHLPANAPAHWSWNLQRRTSTAGCEGKPGLTEPQHQWWLFEFFFSGLNLIPSETSTYTRAWAERLQ